MVQKLAEGGGFYSEVRNLAIPFGLLLAERGIHGMLSKNIQKNKKNATKKQTSKTKKGGECSSCNQLNGGNLSVTEMSNQISNEFARVTSRIEGLLRSR